MADPANLDEYLKRFHRGEIVTGEGIGNVYMHSPCPFCAAPEWMSFEILNVRPVMERGATCKECGRSAKAIFADDFGVVSSGGVSFEIVQTGGDDPAPWLVPKMRRV